MKVEACGDPGVEWEDFVERQPQATLGHARGWAPVLQEAYGIRPCYLIARGAGDEIEGVLPLVHFRGLKGALELVSLPFLDAAGILGASAAAERALLDAALQLARSQRARALELRQVQSLQCLPAEGDAVRIDLALALERDEAQQWQAIGSKVRNQTRKAQREELAIADGDAAGLLPSFYQVYATNMRDLGSPPHRFAFFASMARQFDKSLRCIVAQREGRAIGALIAIRQGDRVFVPWASTLKEERHRCPNNLIYWEAIRWAVSLGVREFDFGRSPPGSGTHQFKRGWGAEERPLAWARVRADGSREELASLADQAFWQGLSRIWSRLPVPLSTWLGSRIRSRLAN